MKYLFDEWDSLQTKIRSAYIMLFLDYDGTLTPIVETPEKAVISPTMQGLLRELSRLRRLKIAIISGRSLNNIKRMVGVEGIIYAGNHGMEISGPKIKFRHPISLRSGYIIEKIKESLCRELAGIKGVLVEDKGLTFSVHYRLASSRDEAQIKREFKNVTGTCRLKKQIRVTFGKKVLEVRPPVAWDKGKVALWLLGREKFKRQGSAVMSIYLGDDITDEDAFRALLNKGLTVFVGRPRKSHAKYYLNNTAEVLKFLRRIKVCLL